MRLMRRLRRRLGFTLAEVLIAMFVLTVGIAGVTASLWWATKNQGAGREMTEASNHGRVLMEALISSMEVNWTALKGGNAWPDQNSGVNERLNSSDHLGGRASDMDFPLLVRDGNAPNRSLRVLDHIGGEIVGRA